MSTPKPSDILDELLEFSQVPGLPKAVQEAAWRATCAMQKDEHPSYEDSVLLMVALLCDRREAARSQEPSVLELGEPPPWARTGTERPTTRRVRSQAGGQRRANASGVRSNTRAGGFRVREDGRRVVDLD